MTLNTERIKHEPCTENAAHCTRYNCPRRMNIGTMRPPVTLCPYFNRTEKVAKHSSDNSEAEILSEVIDKWRGLRDGATNSDNLSVSFWATAFKKRVTERKVAYEIGKLIDTYTHYRQTARSPYYPTDEEIAAVAIKAVKEC